MKTYNLLERVLHDIEGGAKSRLTAAELARDAALSSVHLQRLFRLAFEQPIAGYIRSRKLAASLTALLTTDLRVIDIAVEYGFGYEQSYIRAFKREYGYTPGEVRQAGRIVKVAPPLQLVKHNMVGDGLFFGPEFVMVPTFHMVGHLYKVPFAQSIEMAPRVARDFWDNDRQHIANRLGDDIYIGLTRIPEEITDFSYYMPSVPVHDPRNPPVGLHTDTFPASLCAKFHYIGQHHYFDLNADVAEAMYDAIDAYAEKSDAGYQLSDNSIYFERIDKANYDGTFCKLEWFTPAKEK